ncbi:TonB-dependent receptor [soil metagenome]
MRTLVLILALCCMQSLSLLAQQPTRGGGAPTGTVIGVVQDRASLAPMGSAAVSLWSPRDNTLVTGTMSRTDGRFVLVGVAPGNYMLRVSLLGYNRGDVAEVRVSADGPTDVGVIRLETAAISLEGLTVTGERAAVQLAPDRNTYQVRDMPAVAGGTATDVLENVPAVEIDVEGRVGLRGSQNVAVQINGRPAPMRGDQLAAFLRQLPANMLDRVEVITNPSARQDPEGMAGIINIVLRENVDLGTSAGFTVGAGTRGDGSLGANVGHQQGPFTIFANYGLSRNVRESTGIVFRENRFLTPVTFLDQVSDNRSEGLSHSFNFNTDFRLNQRDVLSGGFFFSDRSGYDTSSVAYVQSEFDLAPIRSWNRISSGGGGGNAFDYSLNFRRTLAPRTHELSADIRYRTSSSDNLSRFIERDVLGGSQLAGTERQLSESLDSNLGVQIDYFRNFDAFRLEAGYSGSLRSQDSSVDIAQRPVGQESWLADPRSNEYRLSETINAAYAVLSRRMDAFSVQGGLRAEAASRDFRTAGVDEGSPKRYNSLFPSGLISWDLTEDRQLKAGYSKRIQRPHARMLNPLPSSDDPLNVFVGNPDLSPEYTHSFELGYQHTGSFGTVQVTPYYRHTTDVARRFQFLTDEGVTVTTFRNLATSSSLGGDVTTTFRTGPVSGFVGFNASQVATDGGEGDLAVSHNAFAWSTRANASWRVRPGLDLQGNVFYNAARQFENSRMAAMMRTNLSLRQRVMGERGNVTLRVIDPLNQMRFSVQAEDERFYQETLRQMGGPRAMLTFSYNVGQQPRQRTRPRAEQPDGDMEVPIF